MTNRIAQTSGPKLNSLFAMSRAKKAAGSLIQQADVSSIAYRVIDADDSTASASTGSLTVGSVIFNTLQTNALDSRWPANAPSAGYNFGGVIPGSAFADSEKRYFVIVTATMTDATTVTLYQGYHTTDAYY